MDDDAFNDLGYDDDDVECAEPSTQNENCNEPSNLVSTDAAIEHLDPSFAAFTRCRGEFDLGDFNNPIDWHMRIGEEESAAKRRRLEEIQEAIKTATLQILEARRQRFTNRSPSAMISREEDAGAERKKILKFPPLDGYAWFGVCSSDAVHRAYLSSRPEREFRSFCKDREDEQNREVTSRAFCALIDDVNDKINHPRNTATIYTSIYDSQSEDIFAESVDQPPQPSVNNTLWMDKYRPNSFLELVTEEENNRLVLLWLRLWDEYVFHRKFQIDLAEKDSKFLEMDERAGNTLPKFKIMMLSGPSGCGKLILASIAAKQAGYRPFVVSMMELQSTAEFRAKLEDISNLGAMDSLLKQGNGKQVVARPTCLVIHGIDHAGAEMLSCLGSWLEKSSKKGVIRRPVICTCNDLFAQSLKNFKKHCLILKIAGCDRERLRKRLLWVLREENIHLSDAELQELILFSRGDIRLCLNTLQFYCAYSSHRARKRNYLGVEVAMDRLQLGKYDESFTQSSIFDAMNAILTLDYHFNRDGRMLNLSERFKRIQMIMSQRDDTDRFYLTLFNNFSSTLKLTNAQNRLAADLFVQSDLYHHLIYAEQNFTLMRYQSALALGLHLYLAVHVSRRLLFTFAFMAFAEQLRDSTNILATVRSGIMKGGKAQSTRELVYDLLPLLYLIIQPPIQGINVQLFSGQDLHTISKIVALMIAYGNISYELRYDDSGASYRLAPPIDSLVCFDGREKLCRALSNNIRKYIAHQIEIASIRKSSSASDSFATPKRNALMSRTRPNTGKENADPFSTQSQAYDSPPKVVSATPLAMKRKKNFAGFTFHYNQGSSQAIRRNIRIDSLFFK